MGPGNRPLDLDWLEDFLALAETSNFSRAAQARAIAQPAFSRHIRALEEWVGVDLFDRSAHPTTLTAAGRRFHPLLQETLAGLLAARVEARAAHELAASSLSFAATHALSLTFFPRWLGGLEAQLRLGPIQTLSDSSRACEDLMAQRRVQFVLCHGHPEVPGRLDDGPYPMRRLSDDVLVPVAAPGADGAPLHRLGDAAAPPPVLAYGEASGLGARGSGGSSGPACARRTRAAATMPPASSTRRRWRSSSPPTTPCCCAPWRSQDAAWPGCRRA